MSRGKGGIGPKTFEKHCSRLIKTCNFSFIKTKFADVFAHIAIFAWMHSLQFQERELDIL